MHNKLIINFICLFSIFLNKGGKRTMRKLIPLFMMISLILSSLGTADLLKNNNSSQKNIVGIDDGTEYWGLV